ncbi:MAG: exo-alpha-sialidase [Methylococcaceae bacterium]|jgi:hypothetical protein
MSGIRFYLRLIVAGYLYVAFGWVMADQSVHNIEIPALAGSHQHRLSQTADGRLILSWVDSGQGNNYFRFSILNAGVWSQASTVATVSGKLGAAPWLIGLSDGAMAAVWMDYPEGKKKSYLGRLQLARTQDQGKTWSKAIQPYDENARIYDAQMGAVALPEGKMALIWTDMRAQTTEARFQLFSTLIDAEGHASKEQVLDANVCSCCPTDTSADGHVLLTAYRDHLSGEVRDISVARWGTGEHPLTATSSRVNVDNWVLDGCPSNGPAIDFKQKQAVVAWFTGVDGEGKVRVAFSHDSGLSFKQVAELDTDAAGYVDTVLLSDGAALVSWRSRVGPEDELKLARVSTDGSIQGQWSIFRGSFPRWPSRDPVLTVVAKQAYLAWTDASENRVRLVSVDLPKAAN